MAFGGSAIFAPLFIVHTIVRRIYSDYFQGIADTEALHHLAMDALRKRQISAAGTYLERIREIDSIGGRPAERILRVGSTMLALLAGYLLSICLVGGEDAFRTAGSSPLDAFGRQYISQAWWVSFALVTGVTGYSAYLFAFRAIPRWKARERIAEIERAIQLEIWRLSEAKSAKKPNESRREWPREKIKGAGRSNLARPVIRSNHEILGLGATYSLRELNLARRKLAKTLHPDRWVRAPAKDRAVAEAAMKSVNIAYEALRPGAR